MLILVIFVTIPRVTKSFIHKIFDPGNFCSVIAHALHNMENKNVLKGSNSYKNGSLLLSAPYREHRHRSITIAIRPFLCADRSQQGGEESWGTTKEARHVPDGCRRGKGKGGNVRKHQWAHAAVCLHMTSFEYRASGVTKFKTIKINSEDPRQLFTKICTPKNLYTIRYILSASNHAVVKHVLFNHIWPSV